MKAIYDEYVHEYYDAKGRLRFAVAAWNEGTAQYERPLDKRTRELTGCYAEYTRKIESFGGYPTRRQALRRARYLFGES